MFYPGLYFDKTMLLLVPAMIIAFWAQTKVSSTYKRYKKKSFDWYKHVIGTNGACLFED